MGYLNIKVKYKLFPLGTRRRELYDVLTTRRRLYDVVMNILQKVRLSIIGYGIKKRPINIKLEEKCLPLCFPKVEKPQVSIVIPIYNKFIYTYNCLKSILENTDVGQYEIIIVDNDSTDNTPEMLSDIKGVHILGNESRRAFSRCFNIGADKARGEYLVFLKDDTIVTQNWLDELLDAFKHRPDTGLVGSKLINPDGRLIEAGGIVWNDASWWDYGKFDDPDRPEYNYLREVDYCSSTCIMVPKKLFLDLGGFDTGYVKTYYADIDLAFRIGKTGRKVLYQPLSQIIHFEILNGDVLSCEEISWKEDAVIFLEKWQTSLIDHRAPGESPHLEKDRGIKKRILVVDACMLTPDQDSGSLRMYNLLSIFQSISFKTTFIANNREYSHPYTRDLQARGVEVVYAPYISSIKDYLRRYGGILDVVLLSRVDVAKRNIDNVRKYAPNAVVLFDTVDLHFVREEREAELKGDYNLLLASRYRKNDELGVAEKADFTLVVSDIEKEIIDKERNGLKVRVISNIHEIYGSSKSFSERRDILFIGGFLHPPNVDAMVWFVREVFPLVRKRLMGIKLYIVGSHPASAVKRLIATDIIVTGYVPDVAPYFNNCKVSIAPLRYGAGVKGKVNLSMSYGVPIVATSIASEGMHCVHGEDMLIADDPAGIAEAILRLYQDEGLWNKLSQNGIDNVLKYFSFDAVSNNVKLLMEEGVCIR